MKRCPTCHQTFEEEWLSFCTQDGTTLMEDSIASNDPPPTIMAPAPSAGWNAPSAELPPSSPEWRPPQPVAPAWQPPPPPWQPPPPPPYAPNKNLAIASMVLGIISVTVGWFCFGPIPGIAAIILGGVALSQMKKNPDRVGGKPHAWTGIATGSATLVIYAVFLVIYIIALVASA